MTAAPSPELERFLEPFDPAVRTLALQARALVLSVAPDAGELLYDSYNAVAIAFTFSARMNDAFCHIAAYSRHVNVGFNRGAELPDPERLLQGSGKLIRHLKITRREDIEQPHLRRSVELAAARAPRPLGSPAEHATIVQAVSARKRRPRK
jgi:hypothetical protein